MNGWFLAVIGLLLLLIINLELLSIQNTKLITAVCVRFQKDEKIMEDAALPRLSSTLKRLAKKDCPAAMTAAEKTVQ